MKNILCYLILLPFWANSQTEKGAAPLNPPRQSVGAITNPQSVRAVVIGISDYQDPAIPDLRFADKDAEAFANYLRSPAGGSLDDDHLKLLTNQLATTAQFDAALGWLIDESKEGDQAIIYFSGHGDVEAKTRSQQGFLLCWDSPPQAYVSGAYPIFFLKEVVSTLSMENKARVIVITDACRSGKLAGNSIGGSQLTSQNLAQQFSNEIKILSCQPNEYSIEGEQWGGGRGAFSFHLLDGLYGLADGNADASVNLMEIGRYLEDKVTTEVAPQSQVPMTIGNRTEKLTSVVPELLAQVKKGKAGQLPIFSGTDSRGIEEDVLASVDTTIREVYRMFKKALKEKIFLEPAGACADAYYERLIAEPKMERLHNAMRRNYAAALQDDAQQESNNMLKTGLSLEVLHGRYSKVLSQYGTYPHMIERAAELLGPGHYMYATLKARQAFFMGKIEDEPDNAKKYYQEALRWQPDMPQALAEMITVWSAQELDSANVYTQKALAVSPQWVVPYIQLSNFYIQQVNDIEKGEKLLEQLGKLDTASALVCFQKGNLYKYREDYPKAVHWYQKAISSAGEGIIFNRAHHQLGDSHLRAGQYELAETALLKAVNLDSTYQGTLNRLGKSYWLQGKYEKAEEAFNKEIRLTSNFREKSMAYNELGNVFSYLKRDPDAIEMYQLSINADSTNPNGYINLAITYNEQARFDDAEKYAWSFARLDSTFGGYIYLGIIYANQGKFAEAETFARKGLRLCSPEIQSDCLYDFARVMSLINKPADAFEALDKFLAINLDYNNYFKGISDFNNLRALPEWQAMMKKYFPDQVKD